MVLWLVRTAFVRRFVTVVRTRRFFARNVASWHVSCVGFRFRLWMDQSLFSEFSSLLR